MLFALALCVAECGITEKNVPLLSRICSTDFSQISCYWFAGFRSHKVRFSRLSEVVTLAIYNVVIVQTVKIYTAINNAMPKQSILMTLSCFKKNFLV